MKQTTEQIKNESIERGVDEWFFDQINDLTEYTVEEIVEMWEDQNN
jgi:hypothetical protein